MAGYAPTAWTCTNGDGGAFDAGTRHRRRRRRRRSPARSPTTTSRSSCVIKTVIVNDDGGSAIVDDFGITTSAGTLAFGAAVEAPTDTFTYTAATLEVAPGTYTLAELALAGYAPTAWTCTNGDGGAFDAGTRDRRGRRRRRSPARSPTTTSRPADRHQDASSTTTAAPRPSTTSASPPAPARSPSAPPSAPGRPVQLHLRDAHRRRGQVHALRARRGRLRRGHLDCTGPATSRGLRRRLRDARQRPVADLLRSPTTTSRSS